MTPKVGDIVRITHTDYVGNVAHGYQVGDLVVVVEALGYGIEVKAPRNDNFESLFFENYEFEEVTR